MPAIAAYVWPVPTDGIDSVTTDDQLETEQAIHRLFRPLCSPNRNLLNSSFLEDDEKLSNPWLPASEQPEQAPMAKLVLERQAHIDFLTKLLEPLPGAYTAFDTNRSWLLYWILHSFDILSTVLDPKGRARAIATLLSFQNTGTGGFGGGPNQIAHLMSTYAAVCALAIIGGPGSGPSVEQVAQGKSVEVGQGGWDEIDRPKLYSWMMSLKQPDGSFLVHVNGEVDVRASYCVACIAGMLGIMTPDLVQGMGPFVASCQTYEGGLAASSQPIYAQGTDNEPFLQDEASARPALGEAHGGYAFCSLATHLALSLIPEHGLGTASGLGSAGLLKMDSLVRWATQQQGISIEGCGFRGRTNKLVDGCYGWFSGGGLFTAISAVLENELVASGHSVDDFNGLLAAPLTPTIGVNEDAASDGSAPSWTTVDSGKNVTQSEDMEQDEDLSPLCLYDRVGLQEYILIAAQRPASQGGGLRDKPGKRPDAYHTCYNLAGLALAQHSVRLSPETKSYLAAHYKVDASPLGDWNKYVYSSLLSWTLSARDEVVVAASEQDKATNRINPVHPIFNITFPKAKAIMDWAYNQA